MFTYYEDIKIPAVFMHISILGNQMKCVNQRKQLLPAYYVWDLDIL